MTFLTLLPFEEEIWDRGSSELGETYESLYWKSVNVFPYGKNRDLSFAVEKLINFGRECEAVRCVSSMSCNATQFDAELAICSLIAVLDSEDGVDNLDPHDTVELIVNVQKMKSVNQESLFRIKWNFLPWLNQHSSTSPITLEKYLATKPEFFSEVIGLVYRSRKDVDGLVSENNNHRELFVSYALKLFMHWKYCPGIQKDGSFDIKDFNDWIIEVRRITESTGHTESAQVQIGRVLTHAPYDPNGLWIHESVATILNYRDTNQMRSSFCTELRCS